MTLFAERTPYALRLPNMGKHLYPPPLTPITAAGFRQYLSAPPRGNNAHLYLHFPFCETICSFCVLHKYQLQPGSPVPQYFAALKKELLALSRLPLVRQLRFTTIYLGGGTPSLTDDHDLADILAIVMANFHVDNPQITFEGHVHTLTREKMRFARTLGVNRVSTGVQTFDPDLRQILNLVPTEREIRACADDARAAGFDDFNVDMMYNLPGQTLSIWENDLRKAVSLDTTGMDIYETVVTRGTALSGRVQRNPSVSEQDPQLQAKSYLLSESILNSSGFRQRNLHVWDRPGYENRLVGQQDLLRDHQLTIIGAGLSAYGFVNGMPFINVTGLREYIDRVERCEHGVEAFHQPTPEEEMERFMTLSLQTIDFDRTRFRELFGRDMNDVFAPQLASFLDRGLVMTAGAAYRLTPLGRAWASTMTMEFFGGKVLENFIRARIRTSHAPGFMNDVTHEELYDFVIFTLFHPEIMIKAMPNVRLMLAYLRFLRKTTPGWLRRVSGLGMLSARRYGLPPFGWYVRAAARLAREAVAGRRPTSECSDAA